MTNTPEILNEKPAPVGFWDRSSPIFTPPILRKPPPIPFYSVLKASCQRNHYDAIGYG